MNRIVILTGTLLLLTSAGAAGEEPRKPPTAAAQGAAGAQGGITASGEGATASGRTAGSAQAGAGSSSASLAQGTEISATLTKPVDAGKAKPGDPVEARATKDLRSGDEVLVPRGSRLIGRVTQASPRVQGSAGGNSALGIVFDRAVLKDGRSLALNGAVTALGAARTTAAPGFGGASGGGGAAGSASGSGGGLTGTVGGTVSGVAGGATSTVGNVGATAGGAAGAAARSAGAVGGFEAGGGLMSGSRGVFGMRGLEIASATDASAEGSVISSAQRTVRLEGGTQMLIVAGGRAAEKPAEDAQKAPPARDKPGQDAREDRP
jgi:hypothetical protein